MTIRRRAPLVFALALAFTGALVAAPLAAQEATPVTTGDGRDIPDPAECTVAPRTPESLASINATPVTGGTPDERTPPAVPFGAPDGTPAGPEDAAAITAAVRTEWACLNANDFPRTFALYTDDLLRRLLPPEELADLMAPPAEGTPAALPVVEQTALFAVLAIELLGDNRAGAFVIVDTFGDPLPVEVNYYVLVEQDGVWLMDDFLCYAGDGTYC